MVTAWFFLALFGHGVTQAGPFVSVEQCQEARVLWEKQWITAKATPCYQGVVK